MTILPGGMECSTPPAQLQVQPLPNAPKSIQPVTYNDKKYHGHVAYVNVWLFWLYWMIFYKWLVSLLSIFDHLKKQLQIYKDKQFVSTQWSNKCQRYNQQTKALMAPEGSKTIKHLSCSNWYFQPQSQQGSTNTIIYIYMAQHSVTFSSGRVRWEEVASSWPHGYILSYPFALNVATWLSTSCLMIGSCRYLTSPTYI